MTNLINSILLILGLSINTSYDPKTSKSEICVGFTPKQIPVNIVKGYNFIPKLPDIELSKKDRKARIPRKESSTIDPELPIEPPIGPLPKLRHYHKTGPAVPYYYPWGPVNEKDRHNLPGEEKEEIDKDVEIDRMEDLSPAEARPKRSNFQVMQLRKELNNWSRTFKNALEDNQRIITDAQHAVTVLRDERNERREEFKEATSSFNKLRIRYELVRNDIDRNKENIERLFDDNISMRRRITALEEGQLGLDLIDEEEPER